MRTLLATIKATSTADGPGTFEAILSVPTVDRDFEVIDSGAFEPLPGHITIDIDHAMSVEKTVASGVPFYEGDLLKFRGTFASTGLAQMVRTLVDEGHIRTMSVAYMNDVYETNQDDGLRHLRKAELLNAGIVGIPSNREALITFSKSLVAEIDAVTNPVLCAQCAETLPSTEGTSTTTTTEENAAAVAASDAPTVPAASSVEVARALLCAAQLALD